MQRLILWKLAAVAFFVGAYFLLRRSWIADFAAVFLIALALNSIAIHHARPPRLYSQVQITANTAPGGAAGSSRSQ